VTRFFDEFPAFYRTGKAAFANRLDARHRVLISQQRELLAGRRILDIASHDGRWSFAALRAGASHATGVEARPFLVERAEETFRGYGVPPEAYQFIVGDVHEQIRQLKPGAFDVIFLFGFFYHTIHHVFMLSEIRRLDAPTVIIDTEIDVELVDPLIRLRTDRVDDGLSAVSEPGGGCDVLVGLPSRAAVEAMLSGSGFRFRYLDWQRAGLTDWTGIEDYASGRRLSLVVHRSG
jgi:hypothetical protein